MLTPDEFYELCNSPPHTSLRIEDNWKKKIAGEFISWPACVEDVFRQSEPEETIGIYVFIVSRTRYKFYINAPLAELEYYLQFSRGDDVVISGRFGNEATVYPACKLLGGRLSSP